MNTRATLLLAALLFTLVSFAQNTTPLRQIDSLVREIDAAAYTIKRDTIRQDHPQIGLSMFTYLTMITTGSELKKFVNNVHISQLENGTTKRMTSTNTFYFDHNALIKVEEEAIGDDK